MKDAFNSMGVFGKICAIVIVATAAKDCVKHIGETTKQRKEAK